MKPACEGVRCCALLCCNVSTAIESSCVCERAGRLFGNQEYIMRNMSEAAQVQTVSAADGSAHGPRLRGCSVCSSLNMVAHRAKFPSSLSNPPCGYSLILFTPAGRQYSEALKNQECHASNAGKQRNYCNCSSSNLERVSS